VNLRFSFVLFPPLVFLVSFACFLIFHFFIVEFDLLNCEFYSFFVCEERKLTTTKTKTEIEKNAHTTKKNKIGYLLHLKIKHVGVETIQNFVICHKFKPA